MVESTAHPPNDIEIAKPDHSLGHFITGAIPMTLGLLIVWWHLLAPIVDHEHQGVLLWFAGILCSVSLTFWLWCVVRFVEARFAKRNAAAHELAMQESRTAAARHRELLALVEKHCRSVQSLHKRLEAIEQDLKNANTEIAHLRELVVESGGVSGSIGPSAYS
ncbi:MULTISPECIES: hypothetical protein [Glycomyces]|uniref:Type VI protein secretion system component VasK n=2 Tax=Glycomyces TaxID=58113 RepID=A0ABU2AHS5_9ACTN|nr:hypothetical protein [Glycomyces lechevalierae]MDR7336769.1 type VI protein secretion system component VasK [Glycomyces lechevalierae]